MSENTLLGDFIFANRQNENPPRQNDGDALPNRSRLPERPQNRVRMERSIELDVRQSVRIRILWGGGGGASLVHRGIPTGGGGGGGGVSPPRGSKPRRGGPGRPQYFVGAGPK